MTSPGPPAVPSQPILWESLVYCVHQEASLVYWLFCAGPGDCSWVDRSFSGVKPLPLLMLHKTRLIRPEFDRQRVRNNELINKETLNKWCRSVHHYNRPLPRHAKSLQWLTNNIDKKSFRILRLLCIWSVLKGSIVSTSMSGLCLQLI